MARIVLHSRPRPADLYMRDWHIPVRSTAGGRVAERPMRMIVKSAANRRGRRVIQGTVVERSTKDFSFYVEYTENIYTLYYLAIDDGTSDQVEGWEVPIEA